MVEEALTHLRARFDADESFTYEQATEVLRIHDVEQLLVGDLLETLLLRGYLYEVNDKLRITEKSTTISGICRVKKRILASCHAR
ncbi:hypothetical protein [Haladaptatus salinisoli]|uniref:hypothetical protein n=1 Tax=Haladaptatus salinisoli TaxID=2884876 RepID=UPI001D0A3964|nr:hypothetical protein [Haladaptatus salinisoli]